MVGFGDMLKWLYQVSKEGAPHKDFFGENTGCHATECFLDRVIGQPAIVSSLYRPAGCPELKSSIESLTVMQVLPVVETQATTPKPPPGNKKEATS